MEKTIFCQQWLANQEQARWKESKKAKAAGKTSPTKMLNKRFHEVHWHKFLCKRLNKIVKSRAKNETLFVVGIASITGQGVMEN